MRRDMDLVREMLKGAADSAGPLDASVFADDAHDLSCICEHVRLMQEAGLIEGKVSRYIGGGQDATIERLTWAGHDFLDAVRNDRIWKKVMLKVAQVTGSATFDVVKALAVHEATAILLQ